MVFVMVNPDVRDAASGGGHFRFAALQVAREVWKERARDLHANAMPGEKRIAGQHAVKIESIDFAGREQFRLGLLITIARAKNIEAGTH